MTSASTRAGTTLRVPAATLVWNGFARALVFLAIAVAIARAAPNPGPVALGKLLAETILAHGVPIGGASLGWLGALGSWAAGHVALGLALASIACAIAALAFVERRARALDASPSAAVLALPLAALCTVDALQPGGGAAAWCFAALAMSLLDGPSLRKLVALAALAVLWCNVEPQGLLAPILALAVAVGITFERPRSAEFRSAWLAVVVTFVACACTPAGVAFYATAADTLRLGDAASGILGVVPATTAPHAYRMGFFVVFAAAIACGSGVRARDAAAVATTFVLALANGAFVPLFGIVAAPAVVAALRRARVSAFAAPVAGAAFVAALALAVRDAPTAAVAQQPFELAERAAALDPSHETLLCANVEWCDVASAANERVVMDGRIAPFGARSRAAQRAVVAVGRGWRAALARSGATQVLARNDSALATLLGLSPAWYALARDERATLFTRATDGRTP